MMQGGRLYGQRYVNEPLDLTRIRVLLGPHLVAGARRTIRDDLRQHLAVALDEDSLVAAGLWARSLHLSVLE